MERIDIISSASLYFEVLYLNLQSKFMYVSYYLSDFLKIMLIINERW